MINNRRSNYAVGTNDPVYSRRGYTGNKQGSKTHDYIPGINVNNAIQQVMPWNWGKNLDVFDNYSTDDGQGDERRPMLNPDGGRPWFGKTETNNPSLSENKHFGASNDQPINTTGPAIIPAYDPEAAKNRAFLDQSLNRFDSYFGDADRSHDIRLQNINNSYNQSLNRTNGGLSGKMSKMARLTAT